MKEFKFGIYLSENGMEPFGSDELNSLIDKGWEVKSITPSQAFLKENPEKDTSESESVTFAGYEMCAILENPQFDELFQKAGTLSEGLIRLDKLNTPKIGFFDRNKLKQAIDLFEKALDLDPYNTSSHFLKAKCHESLNQGHKALESLKLAFEIEPYNEIICIEIGSALTRERDFERAIEILEEGTQYNPNEPRILSNLGIAYLLSGQAQKAVAVYTKLVEIEPDYELNPRFLKFARNIANGDIDSPKTEEDISKYILN